MSADKALEGAVGEKSLGYLDPSGQIQLIKLLEKVKHDVIDAIETVCG